MEGHYPFQPKALHHYDLHVWLWKENPAGVFADTNPRVKCSGTKYGYTAKLDPPPMVPHTKQ